jgi:hypothetical protein
MLYERESLVLNGNKKPSGAGAKGSLMTSGSNAMTYEAPIRADLEKLANFILRF